MSVNRPVAATVTPMTPRPNKPAANNVDGKTVDRDRGLFAHEKPGIKAPKQIKEKIAPTVSSKATTIGAIAAQIEMLDSLQQHTSNPNIPKLFQKYEKIQEIYPEFHPYVVQQPKQPPSNGGKPSRDGSRNLFFTGSGEGSGNAARKGLGDLANLGTLGSLGKSPFSLSSAAISSSSLFAPASKKSSTSSQQTRTQNSAFVSSSTKLGKG